MSSEMFVKSTSYGLDCKLRKIRMNNIFVDKLFNPVLPELSSTDTENQGLTKDAAAGPFASSLLALPPTQSNPQSLQSNAHITQWALSAGASPFPAGLGGLEGTRLLTRRLGLLVTPGSESRLAIILNVGFGWLGDRHRDPNQTKLIANRDSLCFNS
ncbi:hypothetical protein M422DRAFT_269832 [Sphaerobolus stellatus SS14]|uniref:Unplaced genomic scaffold SPHSTscaffold_221, whole genome shotgun sequence n=1 Tax=Sphaerobolus stellatus (strain SS14) TaxID=990650 RepID=A0A0C9UUL0_SPHS4|nr:hypothetical protein M422DRAFT_269832 [Sphaerobolus stellatus SS14]